MNSHNFDAAEYPTSKPINKFNLSTTTLVSVPISHCIFSTPKTRERNSKFSGDQQTVFSGVLPKVPCEAGSSSKASWEANPPGRRRKNGAWFWSEKSANWQIWWNPCMLFIYLIAFAKTTQTMRVSRYTILSCPSEAYENIKVDDFCACLLHLCCRPGRRREKRPPHPTFPGRPTTKTQILVFWILTSLNSKIVWIDARINWKIHKTNFWTWAVNPFVNRALIWQNAMQLETYSAKGSWN